MTEPRKDRIGGPAQRIPRGLVEIADQPVQSLPADEISPTAPTRPAHERQLPVEDRLALIGAVLRPGRPALGRETKSHRDRFDDGRLAAAIGPDEHGRRPQVEPVAQQLGDGSERERPLTLRQIAQTRQVLAAVGVERAAALHPPNRQRREPVSESAAGGAHVRTR